MTNATTDRFKLELDGLHAVAIPVEAGPQPWSDLESYRVEVTVQVFGLDADAGTYQTLYHGSRHDFDKGERPSLSEAAWTVVDDLLSAAYDPDEFWDMATTGGGKFDRARIENVLRVLDFAAKAEPVLDRNADRINAWRDSQ